MKSNFRNWGKLTQFFRTRPTFEIYLSYLLISNGGRTVHTFTIFFFAILGFGYCWKNFWGAFVVLDY